MISREGYRFSRHKAQLGPLEHLGRQRSVGFFEMDWLSCFGIAGTYESRFLEPERVLNGYRANFSAVLLAQEQSQIPPIDETWPQSVV